MMFLERWHAVWWIALVARRCFRRGSISAPTKTRIPPGSGHGCRRRHGAHSISTSSIVTSRAVLAAPNQPGFCGRGDRKFCCCWKQPAGRWALPDDRCLGVSGPTRARAIHASIIAHKGNNLVPEIVNTPVGSRPEGVFASRWRLTSFVFSCSSCLLAC